MANWQTAWSEHVIGRRMVEVFSPTERPCAAVIWLHGYDEATIRARVAFEKSFAEQGLLVVCPFGGRGWWLDLPLPEFEPPLTPARLVTEALVDWLAERYSIAPPRIGLAGIGMGGQGAVNLAFRNARRFPVVAGIAPDIDFHQWYGAGTPLDHLFASGEAARQQTATLHLHPLNWPRHLLLVCDPDDAACCEGTERLASKLVSSGVPFDCDFTTRAGGHSWTYFERMIPQVARFLREKLAQVTEG